MKRKLRRHLRLRRIREGETVSFCSMPPLVLIAGSAERGSASDECALVSRNVVLFALNVVSRPPIESINVVEKSR